MSETETAVARLVVANLPELLFMPGVGWHRWTGVKWATDGAEGELYREIIRRVDARYAMAPSAANARLCEHRAVEGIAKICARLASAPPSTLDTRLDLLHTAGVTWNLATGECWPSRPEERNTKAAALEPAEQCPQWHAFLDSCFPGEPEMVAYLQRLVGYGITGYVNEQVFVLMQGSGANGKSTFINALTHAFKDYCLHLPVQVLMNTSAVTASQPVRCWSRFAARAWSSPPSRSAAAG